ncbi:hypothetical protein EKO04_005894 [Ascochyta lentis]|uniref:2EXR domain-containing protein n=1 Tax=Ascochyta lentis TaxID=205686 RepID=A0A8H7J5R9_9PLEO|nr:hypothetical protein EKO04_005894 [Ascochyta lentis]
MMEHIGVDWVGYLRLTGWDGADTEQELEEERENVEQEEEVEEEDEKKVDEEEEEEQEEKKPMPDLATLLCLPSRHLTSLDQLLPDLQFHRFTDLPRELRERIYAHALTTGTPIQPQLCDQFVGRGNNPKFHDNQAVFHNSVAALLGITRVSRKIRSESVPIFYGANTFATGPDTATYFAFLQRVGRFEMVRRVMLSVSFEGEKYAAWVLRCVNQFDKEVEQHETTSMERGSSCSAAELRSHPRYRVGGFSAVNLALLLRMLSTPASTDTEFTSCIVLPVSNPAAFHDYTSLRWFPSLVEGLGMELRFALRPETVRLGDHIVEVEWHRRFQGKEYAGETVAAASGVADGCVMKRALDMYPDMEEMRRPEKVCYYRTACSRDAITWYDVQTLGGGQ